MDDRQDKARGGDGREHAPVRPLDVGEREGERRRDEQLAGRRRGQAERRVGAAVGRRECRHADLGADDRDRRTDAPEERVAGLVGDEKCERREHGGLVQDDLGWIEERDPSDERQKAVPEREGVARMQAAVGELVDRLEREGVERLQLANPRQVEEAVAADLAGDVPEQHAEHHSGSEHPPPPGNPLRPRRAPHERERHDAGAEQQDERQRERRAGGERDGQRTEEERERPGEGDRGASQPESPCDHRSRPQQNAGREREAYQRHRSSSSGTRPDASQSAASRYIRPRSSRNSRARSRSDQPSSRRARSA